LRIGPGDALEHLPPAVDDEADVEAQHEGDGNLATVAVAV